MSLRHTCTAVVMITTLLLALAAPAGAATDTTSRGTAATTSVPLQATVGDLTTKLGEVALLATTDGDVEDRAPWSSVGLTLADIGGTAFGDLSVSSDGDTTNPGTSIGEDTALGSVGAEVANLLALADDTAGSATAAVTSLSTAATILENDAVPTGLGLQATITDVVSSVDATGAAATHSLALSGIDLDLAHLLGSVLDTLPLQDLLAIADELGVRVDGLDLSSAEAVISATEDLLVAVAAVTTTATAVQDAAGGLTTAEALDPLADYGDIDAIRSVESTVDALAGGEFDLLTTLTSAITDLSTAGLDCDVSLTDVAAALTLIQDCIDDHLQDFADALASLTDEFDALATAVDDYVTAVTDATDAAAILEGDGANLGDIVGQIQTLLENLLTADLAALGPVNVTQQVRAIGGQYDASSASHTCNVTTITALAGDPLEIADCDAGDSALTPVVDTVTTTLGTIFETIGGIDAGDGIALELFGKVEDTVSEGDGGLVRATSVLEVLRLTVPQLTITPCDVDTVGQLVCALGLDLAGPLDDALNGVDGVLATAQGTVTTALTSVGPITNVLESELGLDPLADVGVVGVSDAQSIVDTAVGVLETVITDLTGDLGDLGTGGGVTVPRVEIVVDPQLEAEHQVVAASVDNPTPANPAPNPARPSLPNTGGGAAMLAVLAIGAGAWLWRGRRGDA